MDLRFTPEELAFRDEVRAFFRANLPASIRTKLVEGKHLAKDDIVTWQRTLNKKGWAVANWPIEWGGTGWTPVQQYIFQEELQQTPAPQPLGFGVTMVGPVIIAFGSEAQKKRYLPAIANLDVWWCQGFSEPGAGSDLASLRTSAKREDGHYIVNGQKTWTTLAQHADWIFCLVRTDPQAKKQEGISFLLIDMKTPGITVRPIVTIEGGHEVNEVFFDDVKVPAENLVGQENKGWDYAKYLLGRERTGIARVGLSKERIRRIKELAATGDCRRQAADRGRALPREAGRGRGRIEGTRDDAAARRRRRAPSHRQQARSGLLDPQDQRHRRSSRQRPNCCSRWSAPTPCPTSPSTRMRSAGTSRRSARNGPARSPRLISTGARPRSMAAPTRSRRTSSPRRSWDCEPWIST